MPTPTLPMWNETVPPLLFIGSGKSALVQFCQNFAGVAKVPWFLSCQNLAGTWPSKASPFRGPGSLSLEPSRNMLGMGSFSRALVLFCQNLAGKHWVSFCFGKSYVWLVTPPVSLKGREHRIFTTSCKVNNEAFKGPWLLVEVVKGVSYPAKMLRLSLYWHEGFSFKSRAWWVLCFRSPNCKPYCHP